MTTNAKKKARKKPKKTKSMPGRRRPPVREKFDLFAPGPAQAHIKPGSMPLTPRLPSLMEAVREAVRYQRRKDFIKGLCEQYSCSPATIDRAIAEVTRENEEYASQDRAKRVAHKIGIYQSLAKRAEAIGELRTSIQALKRIDILMGDEAPKKLIVDTPMEGQSSQQLLEQAERLRKMAGAS